MRRLSSVTSRTGSQCRCQGLTLATVVETSTASVPRTSSTESCGVSRSVCALSLAASLTSRRWGMLLQLQLLPLPLPLPPRCSSSLPSV